jgi:hypothetical protein
MQHVADKIARDKDVAGTAEGSIVFTIVNGKVVNAYAALEVSNETSTEFAAPYLQQVAVAEKATLFDLLYRLGDHRHVDNPDAYTHLGVDCVRKRLFEHISCLEKRATGGLRERVVELEAELSRECEGHTEWFRHAREVLNIQKPLGIVDVGRSNMRRIEFLEAENAALRASNRPVIARLISWARSLVKR